MLSLDACCSIRYWYIITWLLPSAWEVTRSDERWEYFYRNIATGIGILYIHNNFDLSMGGEK